MDQEKTLKHLENREYATLYFVYTLLFVLIPDQLAKYSIIKSASAINYGPFGLFIWNDDNFFLNFIPGLPIEVVKIFSFILCFYLLLLGFGLIWFLKNKNLFLIKNAISIIFASVIGLFIDKIFFGHTRLFFHFTHDFLNISINWAHITLAFGAGLLVAGSVIHWKEIIGKDNRRKTYLIEPNYQLSTALIFSGIILVLSITIILFSYFYFNNYIFNFNLGADNKIVSSYLIGIFSIVSIFILLSFVLILIYTHKTVGPLKALDRYLDLVFEDNEAQFTMRQGDHLQELESIASKLQVRVKEITPPPLPGIKK